MFDPTPLNPPHEEADCAGNRLIWCGMLFTLVMGNLYLWRPELLLHWFRKNPEAGRDEENSADVYATRGAMPQLCFDAPNTEPGSTQKSGPLTSRCDKAVEAKEPPQSFRNRIYSI